MAVDGRIDFMKRLILCAFLPALLLFAACAAPVAQETQTAPAQTSAPTPAATPTAAPVAEPAPAAKKQYAIQGPDGKLRYVDADAIDDEANMPSDVCRAGEDVPLNHCAECPQATEGYNTAQCSDALACCPFCPHAMLKPLGCSASSALNAAESALAKQEKPAS